MSGGKVFVSHKIFAGVFLEGVDNSYYDSEWFFLQGMSFNDFQKVFIY